MGPTLELLDDTELIEMTLAGKTECFAVLMDRHVTALKLRICSIVQNAFDAEDVLQEVLFKAWRGLSGFRSQSSLRTWLFSISTNEALMLVRRQQRTWLFDSTVAPDALPSSQLSPDDWLIRKYECMALRRALRNLPAKYRRVMILRDIEQLTIKETAHQLGATVPVVKTRLFRGRRMLQRALRQSVGKNLLKAAA
jgi:RNA polymerase sigma-70 factor (ECF subfamily)